MASENKEGKKTKRPTAQKRLLQSEKSRLVNKMFRSRIRTASRALRECLSAEGDMALAQERLNAVCSLLDKGVKRGVLKLNKASRDKSRLAAQVNRTEA